MLRILALFTLISLVGCNSTKQIGSSNKLLFSIEKGPCFGTCPEYKVEVFSSGKAMLHAIRNVGKVGDFHGQLSKADLNEVNSSISKIKIDSLDTFYVNKYLTDFQATDICIGAKLQVKCIHICHENPPQEVVSLMQELTRLEKLIHWEDIKDVKNHD